MKIFWVSLFILLAENDLKVACKSRETSRLPKENLPDKSSGEVEGKSSMGQKKSVHSSVGQQQTTNFVGHLMYK